MENPLDGLAHIKEPDHNMITFYGSSNQELFSLKMQDGKLVGSTTDPDAIDEASTLFFENLKIHGASLVDRLESIKRLANDTPNDMELGMKLRKLLDEDSINRTR